MTLTWGEIMIMILQGAQTLVIIGFIRSRDPRNGL